MDCTGPSLAELGYTVDAEQRLRDREGRQFQWEGQQQYELLAGAVTREINRRMESLGLRSVLAHHPPAYIGSQNPLCYHKNLRYLVVLCAKLQLSY